MKIKKILLFAKAISPAVTTPIALVSVSANGNLDKHLDGNNTTNGTSGSNNNSNSANNGTNGSSPSSSGTSGKKKEVSPQFSSFKDKAQNAVDAVLKKQLKKLLLSLMKNLKK